jgi:hypothetical protein
MACLERVVCPEAAGQQTKLKLESARGRLLRSKNDPFREVRVGKAQIEREHRSVFDDIGRRSEGWPGGCQKVLDACGEVVCATLSLVAEEQTARCRCKTIAADGVVPAAQAEQRLVGQPGLRKAVLARRQQSHEPLP